MQNNTIMLYTNIYVLHFSCSKSNIFIDIINKYGFNLYIYIIIIIFI
jgi:hypothetical protein